MGLKIWEVGNRDRVEGMRGWELAWRYGKLGIRMGLKVWEVGNKDGVEGMGSWEWGWG